MDVSKNLINLIKQFEGCRLVAYEDIGGVWTIGFGHTRGVTEGEKITQSEAENLLKGDIKSFAEGVSKLVKVHINQNQFDALVSLAYNIGLGAFGDSSLLIALNKGDISGAGSQILLWDHVTIDGKKVVSEGLRKRRTVEYYLFNAPVPQVVNKPVHKFTSIVDYLKAHNLPSDFASRRELAHKHGINPYSGRADENIKLLNILQG